MFLRNRLVVLLIGTLTGLLVAELLLRLAGMSYPQLHAWDPHTGARLIANASGWVRVADGRRFITYNSRGLRDREHTFEKPGGTYRILVLGDSFTEALDVDLDQTYWSVLQRLLPACLPDGYDKVETINFGVGDTGTGQQLLKLRHHDAWRYEPDMVLLAFFAGNDITDNIFALRGVTHVPYFLLREGRLTLDESFRENWVSRLRSSPAYGVWVRARSLSRVLQVVNWAKARLRTRRRSLANVPRWPESPEAKEGIFYEPGTPELVEAWAVTEALLRRIHQESRDNGAELFLVTVSSATPVHPDRQMRQRILARLETPDFQYADRRLLRLARSSGFSALNLTPPLQTFADRTGVFLHGSGDRLGEGHWNAEGHRVAGELIAKKLCDGVIR